MSSETLLQFVGILVLGISAQWVAWRLHLPSILLLLAAGILAGPVTGFLQPGPLFGDLLQPLVSLSVAVILYEGGLNLKLSELRGIGRVFFLLITVGALLSWVVGAVAAHYLLGFEWPIAALFGSILIVTGPTVIGPILRHLRLRGKVAALLKWEGIVIDPMGAILAVLVFAIVGKTNYGISETAIGFFSTLAVGAFFGIAAAALMILALSKFWLPDFLHNPVSLMIMALAFALGNMVQEEAGLLVVTVMGIAMANQSRVSIRHVIEFKETITVLLISCVFIILSANLPLDDLRKLGGAGLWFVAVMILVARPLSVMAATLGSALEWRERLFLACMAPRGIVAVAVSSVFALSLDGAGYPHAIEIVSVTFLVVFLTVLFYGLGSAPLARRLGLVHIRPQGVLLVGAHDWARDMAHALQTEGCSVVLIDTDWENSRACRMAGLKCHYGSALAEQIREQIDFGGLGKMLAVTANNEVNSLACLHYTEDFGRQEVYQLPFASEHEGRHEAIPLKHRGRLLFHQELTFTEIGEIMRHRHQPKIKKTKLTMEFDYKAFQAHHNESVVPLFVLQSDGALQVCTVNGNTMPKPGDIVFGIDRRITQEPPDLNGV
ncbi:MAG: cation:proton antiporter [Deltaproteobacteria bacterium]|nr:cation:proton antiporter [Deltaproteobacteria bacterium]